jgi:peptidoglycan lytic transglycosylase G
MPNRSRRARHPLVMIGNAIFTLLVILALAAGGAFYFGREKFQAPGPLAQAKVVNIPRGLGIKDISDILAREGVIDQPYVFMGGVVALKARGELKYGEYRFAAHASLAEVVDTMMEGKVVQHAFTVPEGLTSEQIVARLQENDILTGQITHIPAEGTLLPETYKFTRGISRQQVIERMQQSEKHALAEIWARRDPELPLKSPQELVTLASIVEKETGKPEERTRVAAVFVNRLRRKMRLQSDPTIIYGLVGGKGSLSHGITVTEKAQPTPYNTYVIDGLPPGPIGNPGRASLEAVANPARTKELYFVADGTGGHVFSETYEQHQKYVGKLREREDEATDATPQPATPAVPALVAAPAPTPARAAAAATPAKPARRRAAQRHRAQPQQQ